MGIFGMFGKKKERVEGGDYGGDMVGMMKMMAEMPDTTRKPMMKSRLTQILSLPEERRQESIRNLIGAFHNPEIKEGTRDKLVATRVEIIGEMPEDKRRTIMKSRIAALKVAPQLKEADQRVTKSILPEINESARTALTTSMDDLMNHMSS